MLQRSADGPKVSPSSSYAKLEPYSRLESFRSLMDLNQSNKEKEQEFFNFLLIILRQPKRWTSSTFRLPDWFFDALLCILSYRGLPVSILCRVCHWLCRGFSKTSNFSINFDDQYFEDAVEGLRYGLERLTEALSPEDDVYGAMEIYFILCTLKRIRSFPENRVSSTKYTLKYVNNLTIIKRDVARQSSYDSNDRKKDIIWCFVDFPFLFTIESKGNILKIESSLGMKREAQDSFFRAIFDGIQQPSLPLSIRRDYIIKDALYQLDGLLTFELRKQLQIRFVGEEAVDQGGPRKEFFHLITREIFDPCYGMFEFSQEDQLFWFSPDTGNIQEGNLAAPATERLHEYYLVGQLIGLAIYNSVLIEVALPTAIFKKILDLPVGFEDLKNFKSSLCRGLEHLLSCTSEEFDDIYNDLTFSVNVNFFNGIQLINLLPNGSNISVTFKDRKKYVDLYSDLFLNVLVRSQFLSFKNGLLSVVGGSLLMDFGAEEIESLVCGSPLLDFERWKSVTVYDGGFHHDSPVIIWFWDFILKEASQQQLQKLLFFITGSRRAPVGGLEKVNLTIMRNGVDSNLLPTAHTCFNYLMFPNYSSRDTLIRNLLMALDNCEGFGLQ